MDVKALDFRNFEHDVEAHYVRAERTKYPFGSRAVELAVQADHIARYGVNLCPPLPEIEDRILLEWLKHPAPLPIELSINPFHKPPLKGKTRARKM